MTTITSLRAQREPTVHDNLRSLFGLPKNAEHKQELSAVLTLEGQEESYVCSLEWLWRSRVSTHILPPTLGWKAVSLPPVSVLSVSGP